MKCKKNYYDILGVTPDSDDSEVKTSYRKLARKFHPDVNKEPGSDRKFKDVLEAYETLSDEKKRKQYDIINGFFKKTSYDFNKKSSTEEIFEKFSYKTSSADNKDSFTYKKSANKYDSLKDTESTNYGKKEAESAKTENQQFKSKQSVNNHENLRENHNKSYFKEKVNTILDEISRNHNDKRIKGELKNGEDIYTEISINVSDAIRGTERILNILHKELCPHCGGRRFINETKCSMCGGSGVLETQRKITVKIPAGIKEGAKLRLVGEGNPGFFGGKNGNLYITLHVDNDENIQIDENNILIKLPISPFEAVLGAQIELPSFGENIKLCIPPKTKTGQKFRISKKGLKTNGKFGDMIITVEIQIPSNISSEELELYAKLRKISGSSVRG